MFRRLILWILILGYLYTLTFDIFLNQYIRIPTPLLCLPLILFSGNIKKVPFFYAKIFIVAAIGLFIYYVAGKQSFNDFSVNFLIIAVCGLYFNYVVGYSQARYNQSIFLFFILLFFSGIVLLLNQFNGSGIDSLRARLIGSPITQSPSGIASAIFTFGYQMAALTGFLFIFSLIKNQSLLIKVFFLIFTLVVLYLGMQRSAALAFVVCLFLFLIFYYKSRIVIIVGVSAIIIAAGLSILKLQDNSIGASDNILAKNERNEKSGENREGLVIENFKVYSNYPYGLIFYGKTWEEVTVDNPVFRGGLTSHNAYLMYFTYMGPFLGSVILFGLFYPVYVIFKNSIKDIYNPDNSLIIALCFAFLAVTINSCFHNASFINANGPTVFLYFAVLHLYNLQKSKSQL